MQKWFIVGALAAVAGGLGWFVWHSLPSGQPVPVPEPAVAVSESFHVSKPLHVLVARRAAGDEEAQPVEWLAREVRHLLGFGRMRVVPVAPPRADAFTLRIEIVENEAAPALARIALLAPDGRIERRIETPLDVSSRLESVRTLATGLPGFLGAVPAAADWTAAIGTEDEAAYDAFVQSASELLGPAGRGFTHPPIVPGQRTRSLERLELLTRRQPQFARAWALLALAYLSLTGDDHAALTRMSEGAVGRSMALSADLAEAHAAAGLIALRRGDWAAAQDELHTALAIDANSVAALEGLACLWADAGRSAAALPLAERAVALQPQNFGARECLTYAQLAIAPQTRRELAANAQPQNAVVARATALTAILAGDIATARRALDRSVLRGRSAAWVDPLIRAAGSERYTAAALRAITHAASEGDIDPSTEVLCGAALRQPDFVFNRMLRLQKQHQHVPLRILWLEETEFLRKHQRFEQIVDATQLASFWQDHGLPDICATDPTVYGCNLRRRTGGM